MIKTFIKDKESKKMQRPEELEESHFLTDTDKES
jgi:hypothetical protein